MRWGRTACQVVGFLVITGMISGVSHAQYPYRYGRASRSAPLQKNLATMTQHY
jgi:hypothetical protein